MEIKIIYPSSYCAGVNNAVAIALKAKEEHQNQNVYILGLLVHNTFVTHFLKEKGIITILNQDVENAIDTLKKDDVVIFTAHGHLPSLEEKIRQKGILFYDATCQHVKENNEIIHNAEKANRKVIYIGKGGHPEAVAALGQGKNIIFYDVDHPSFSESVTDPSPVVINQTTLNIDELKSIHQKILKVCPGAEIKNEVCATTRLRQDNVKKEDGDIYLVIGDKLSSNTNRLYDIAKATHPDAEVYLVKGKEDVKHLDFSHKRKAVISSGASTPSFIIDSIVSYLKSLN